MDVSVPTDMDIGRLLPQIVDILRPDESVSGNDWRLSRLGDPPMDESMTLYDSAVRDGEVLMLTAAEPLAAEWLRCDPCHALVADGAASIGPALRVFPAICCVLLGGFGAVALVWTSTPTVAPANVMAGAVVAVAAAAGAAVVRRLNGDQLMCVPLSLIALFYAGAVGFMAVPPGPPASGLLMAFAASFSASILLLRVIGYGRTLFTAVASLSALIAAVAAAGVAWEWPLHTGGAALASVSLAALGFAPRIALVLSGAGPTTPRIDDSQTETAAVAPDAGLCHRTLTGLVVGSSIAAALGAASVAAGKIHDAGPTLRNIAFTAIVALVLLLRARTHIDPSRRIGLAAAAVSTATAGFAAAAASFPTQAHVISALAAAAGAAALGFLVRPTVSPVVSRIVEVVEYLAIAAVIPTACWVGGIYGLARGVNLL